jgi:hypothetical protein
MVRIAVKTKYPLDYDLTIDNQKLEITYKSTDDFSNKGSSLEIKAKINSIITTDEIFESEIIIKEDQ